MAASPVVRAVKIGLPVLAVATVGAILWSSNLSYDENISFDGVDVAALGEGLKLTNPRFTGATAKGEPFTLTAEWALPDGPSPEVIELSMVKGELNLIDGRFITMSALSGEVLPRANVIELEGSVKFDLSDGHKAQASRARLNADTRQLTADGPVKASGPMGDIEAGSLRVERDGASGPGDYIWFENRVKVRINAENMAGQGG
ncbi:MAG: hypothetical protein AAF401_02525 [Pseudomonadota bacterium]